MTYDFKGAEKATQNWIKSTALSPNQKQVWDDFNKALPVILKALQLADRMQWQPIETAPKDGTEILISGGKIESDLGEEKEYSTPVKASFRERYDWEEDQSDQWVVSDTCYYGVQINRPTRWTPLPKPPKESEKTNV